MTRLTSLLLPIPLVSGWSGEGHQIIVDVASRFFNDRTSRYIESHVGADLYEASNWADSADASARYPESDEYHFSHTPYRDCQPFNLERDCGFPGKEGLCIVTGLADAIEVATNPSASRDERSDSLKFVLHFMGDIHQPMHTGFRDDFGGNAILIGNMVNKTLHNLWDYDLVRRRIEIGGIHVLEETIERSIRMNSAAFFKRLESQINVPSVVANGTTAELVKYTAMLATETTMTSTCKLAYMRNDTSYIENGEDVSEKYMDQRSVTAQVQLSKASARLAILLNAMADVFAARQAEERAVAREERVKKLFEERKRAAEILSKKVHNPLEGNRYAVLAMEFDPIKLQWIMPAEEETVEDKLAATSASAAVDMPSVPVVRKKKPVKDSRAEDRLLDAFVAEAQEARSRTIFEGVAIGNVVLIIKHNLNVITSSVLAYDHDYTPSSVAAFKVKFTGNSAAESEVTFYFDINVFPDNMSVELAVRAILKIRGIPVDGTSDLSAYWVDRAPVASATKSGAIESVSREFNRPPEASAKRVLASGETGYGMNAKAMTEKQVADADLLARRTTAYLRFLAKERGNLIDAEFQAFKARSKGKKAKTIDEFWVDKLGKLKGPIVTIRSGRVQMIALVSTLSDPKYARRIRFNSFDVHPMDAGANAREHVLLLIDPNICDCYLSPPIYKALADRIGRDETGGVIIVERPTLMQELQDIESAMFGTDPARIYSLKAIQFVMINYTERNASWNHPNYRVIEWATKAAPEDIFDPPADFHL